MGETKLTINQWAEEDRPREKMMLKGAQALSDAELLAILIGSGSTNETAVELMRRVLADCDNNLNLLGKRTIQELCVFKGMGPAKAVTVFAACELGKRRRLSDISERLQIHQSQDIYEYFHPKMCDLAIEEGWIMLLNQANKLIKPVRISSGGLTETSVDVRCILREALLNQATSMVLAHNHPSGKSRPSTQDDRLTEKLATSAKMMNIRLLEHIIGCDGSYYS